jgi:hypothetical protein
MTDYRMNNWSTLIGLIFQLSLSVIERCSSSTLYAVIMSSDSGSYYFIYEGMERYGDLRVFVEFRDARHMSLNL